MKSVYVAGPVVRPSMWGELSGVRQMYREMHDQFQISGWEVQLPVSEFELESSRPREFYEEIAARIDASDVVISVLPEVNPSSGIESTMAAFMNKPHFIVTRAKNAVPRLLRGLPNLEGIFKMEEVQKILAELMRLEDENPPTVENPPRNQNPPTMEMGA
jgi:nucleoside 2-deoxyribosyltransferase